MTDKIKELLGVLDMPEEEQRQKIGEFLPDLDGEKYRHALYDDSAAILSRQWKCRRCEKEFSVGLPYGRCPIARPYKDSLADLAFRLRDEVGKLPLWLRGISVVYRHLEATTEITLNIHKASCLELWSYNARPIHLIIAALIAKELAKDG